MRLCESRVEHSALPTTLILEAPREPFTRLAYESQTRHKYVTFTPIMERIQMSEKRIVVVIGATGAQGGGLVRAILNDQESPFAVRAVTRNPYSEQACYLAKLGAEVVKADLDDQGSLERAFKGAHCAFCVTDFWEHFSPDKEVAQARHMARAAKAAGIEHVIWSTLEDTRKWVPLDDARIPTLMGRYKVPHFDAKGEANQLFIESRVPTTFLLTSFYWENFINFGMEPKAGPDGQLAITMPMGDKRLPGIAAVDIGKCAYGIFRQGDEFAGKTVGIAGEHLTGSEMAAAFTRVLGIPVSYRDVPPDVYRNLRFPGAEEFGNMFHFKRDFNDQFCAARDVHETRKLNPGLLSFAAWLAINSHQIPCHHSLIEMCA